MRVLLIHNCYQRSGGEDTVFAQEKALLKEHEHDVQEFLEDNHHIEQMPRWKAAWNTLWSSPSYHRLLTEIRSFKPDIAHFHNTFMMISPSAYYACHRAGVPVVQTIHNYRLICPAATLMRDGNVCEACVGRLPWPAICYGCYRQSRIQSAVVAAMLTLHRWLNTWQQQVDAYIALTSFAREKLIEGRLPAERIHVKPNFLHQDPGEGTHQGNYALFIGRLSKEKGIHTLLEAWRNIDLPLKVAGDGPLLAEATGYLKQHGIRLVELLGSLAREEVIHLLQDARFLVFPSIWYEGFPMTIAEAFACGVPVITSRLGAMDEIIRDQVTGLHFETANHEDLTTKVNWAWENGGAMREMGRAARLEFEEKYGATVNYEQLVQIYLAAIKMKGLAA